MTVLLDECVPRKFKVSFSGHECRTVPEAGFSGKKNGELLSLAERAGFRVLVTMDKGLKYEQNLKGRGIAVIIIRARSNRLADLLPHAGDCLAELSCIQPGQVIRVG
jgi:hypothetical protein